MVSYIDRKYDTTLFTGGSIVNSYIYSFTGLSTDTKPTRTYKKHSDSEWFSVRGNGYWKGLHVQRNKPHMG